MKPEEQSVTVCAVLVNVEKPGWAYGHLPNGRCVRFTGAREDLITLFHRLRAYLKGEGPAVAVRAGDWPQIEKIDRADCPNHMLPAITGEIAYYVPY